jgi:hypothetical protein
MGATLLAVDLVLKLTAPAIAGEHTPAVSSEQRSPNASAQAGARARPRRRWPRTAMSFE